MVRLIDIANELDLNVSVVSRALNPAPDKHAVIKAETRELIRTTAAQMGYRPNRQAAFLKKRGFHMPLRHDQAGRMIGRMRERQGW